MSELTQEQVPLMDLIDQLADLRVHLYRVSTDETYPASEHDKVQALVDDVRQQIKQRLSTPAGEEA
jgi:hypothetical protein